MEPSYALQFEKNNNPLLQERHNLSKLFIAMAERAEAYGVSRYYEPHDTLSLLDMSVAHVDIVFGQQPSPWQRRDTLRPPIGYGLIIAKLEKYPTNYKHFKAQVEQPLNEFFDKQQTTRYSALYHRACLDYGARFQLIDQHLGGRLTDYVSTPPITTSKQRSQAVLGSTLSLGQHFEAEYESYRRDMVGGLSIDIAGRPHS